MSTICWVSLRAIRGIAVSFRSPHAPLSLSESAADIGRLSSTYGQEHDESGFCFARVPMALAANSRLIMFAVTARSALTILRAIRSRRKTAPYSSVHRL